MPSAPPKVNLPKPPPGATPPAPTTNSWCVGHTEPMGYAVVLNAVEGWGKTCMGAHYPGAQIIVVGEDLGYKTLNSAGVCPDIPNIHAQEWKEFLSIIDGIYRTPPDGMKVLVIDTLTGLEALCFDWICKVRFNGNWGTEDGKGFNAFKQGPATALPEFQRMLGKLDAIRLKHGVHILMLSHAMSKTHRDPMGPNYDRYVGWVHDRIWGATKQWADAVLFGTFEAQVETMKAQDSGDVHAHGKGVGAGQRVMFTAHADAYDAKNRFNLPERIDVLQGIADSWQVLRPIFK